MVGQDDFARGGAEDAAAAVVQPGQADDAGGSQPPQPPYATPPASSVAPEPPKKRRALVVVGVVLGIIGACTLIALAWIVFGVVKESSVYDKAEKSYNAALSEFLKSAADRQNDPNAFIVDNRPKIVALRKAVAGAREDVKSLDDSQDKEEYVDTLGDVDASLKLLETIASFKDGASGLALDIEQAEKPERTADDSIERSLAAYRSKKYSEMLSAARSASSDSAQAASALATLDRAHPGLGISDLRDEALSTSQVASCACGLATAYQGGQKVEIDSAAAKLADLETQYEGASRRALRSTAYAVWENPGTAVDSIFKRLDSARIAHAAVYKRIDDGD